MPASPDFSALNDHATRLRGSVLSAMSQQDPARASDFALREGALYLNFARQSYDRPALDALAMHLALNAEHFGDALEDPSFLAMLAALVNSGYWFFED